MPEIISLRDIYKRFGTVVAVNNLSTDIARGEYVAILGPNGAGKTTLLEMIEGIQRPDSGSVEIAGMNWARHGRTLRGKIGLSFQETFFMERLTVRETIRLFASFHQLPFRPAEELLERVGLQNKADAMTGKLSGGQRQKLSLAVAMIQQPEVLLLDEPTTGLDPEARRDIWKILEDLRNRQTTLLLTTHYMEEAEYLCRRIIVMNQGKILADGTLSQLIERLDAPEKIRFAASHENVPADRLLAIPGVRGLEWSIPGKSGTLAVSGASQVFGRMLEFAQAQGFVFEDLEARKANLDDVFIKLAGRHLNE